MLFLQLIFSGICIGAIYSLIALSFNLTFWTSRTFNFAQGNLLMFCAMSTLGFIGWGLNLFVSIICALALTMLIGYIIELVGVRPLLNKANGIGWMVTTLGFGIILQAIASMIWGVQALAFPGIIFETTDYLRIFDIQLSLQLLLVIISSFIIMFIFRYFLKATIWGKAMRAVSEDVDASRLLSINSKVIICASFIISALIAGIAGVLVAPVTGVNPAFGMDLMIKGFVAAVIGGMGNTSGAMLGGLILGVLELLIGGYLPSSFTGATAFVVLILMLSFRPQGILGVKEVGRV